MPSNPADRVRSRLMQASLRALLDRVPGARDVLPHLAALEATLGARGIEALADIPLPALTRICTQLSSLPLPADDAPLQDLLSRLLDALALQDQPPPAPATRVAAAPLTGGRMPFADSALLGVQEATLSAFDAAMAEQATTRPAEP